MNALQFLTTVGFVSVPAVSASSTARAVSFDGSLATYLSAADPTSLRITNTDSIIVCGWIKLTDTTGGDIFSKIQTTNSIPTIVVSITASRRVQFLCQVNSSNGGQTSTGESDAALTVGTKAFFVAVKDPVNKLLQTYIDGGSNSSADYSSDEGVFSMGAGPCYFGGGLIFGVGSKAIIDEFFFCKNPPDLAAAVDFINTTIYNSGNGKRYASLSAANKTTMGLLDWWGFDEASGNRLDLKGSVDLSVTGGVAAATALVS